jgi:hypothetical protein
MMILSMGLQASSFKLQVQVQVAVGEQESYLGRRTSEIRGSGRSGFMQQQCCLLLVTQQQYSGRFMK